MSGIEQLETAVENLNVNMINVQSALEENINGVKLDLEKNITGLQTNVEKLIKILRTYTLTMIDSYGDGWNGATWTITNPANGSIQTFGVEDGSSQVVSFERYSGVHKIECGGGTWDDEITWTLKCDQTGSEFTGIARKYVLSLPTMEDVTGPPVPLELIDEDGLLYYKAEIARYVGFAGQINIAHWYPKEILGDYVGKHMTAVDSFITDRFDTFENYSVKIFAGEDVNSVFGTPVAEGILENVAEMSYNKIELTTPLEIPADLNLYVVVSALITAAGDARAFAGYNIPYDPFNQTGLLIDFDTQAIDTLPGFGLTVGWSIRSYVVDPLPRQGKRVEKMLINKSKHILPLTKVLPRRPGVKNRLELTCEHV